MDSFSNLVNENTFNLYNAAMSAMPAGNLMVSPFSVLYASMLMYLGTHGTTKSNLDNALLFKKVYNADKMAALSDFSNSMSRIKSVQNDSDPSQYMTVSVYNAVFVDRRLKLKPSYVVGATEKLYAVAENKDFVGNPDQSRQDINTWAEEKTGGLIMDLLPSGAVDSSTVAVLVNTVYYNATWAVPFRSEATRKQDFTNIDGTKVSVDIMRKEERIRFTSDEHLDVEYAELEYYNNETSMLILLPGKMDGLRALEKILTVSVLKGLQNKAWSTNAGRRFMRSVVIQLPKFTTETQFDLVGLLKKVGVKDVFSPSADFSEMMSSAGMFINKGTHKTYISVDEKGTVAAAASALSSTRSIRRVFKVDRPFFTPSAITLLIPCCLLDGWRNFNTVLNQPRSTSGACPESTASITAVILSP